MATEGLIDIHFSQAFVDCAKRAQHTTDDDADSLLTLRYQSKPASLVRSQASGTLWTSPPSDASTAATIHASFPSSASSSTSKPHHFSSVPLPATHSSLAVTTSPELYLIYSPTSRRFILEPTHASNTIHLRPDRSSKLPPQVPRVPTNEELGKKAREFWEGQSLPNPFTLPAGATARGLGLSAMDDTVMTDSREATDEDEEEEEEAQGPTLANVPTYLRNPAVASRPSNPAHSTDVEDFGSFSFDSLGRGTKQDRMQVDESPASSSGLVLPKKDPETEATVSRDSDSSRPRIVRQSQAPPRPQFSSKIPASSQRRLDNAPLSTSVTTIDEVASESSSEDDDDDDDDDFEDVSVPIKSPHVASLPSIPPLAPTHPNAIHSPLASSSTSVTPSHLSSSKRSHEHQRLSTSLRNIIDPPSSPIKPPVPSVASRPPRDVAPVPTPSSSTYHHVPELHPHPPLPPPATTTTTNRPMTSGKIPIKKRKTSLLPEDQASSDSSSSDGDDDDDGSGSGSEDDLEASINASMLSSSTNSGHPHSRVAMSSGGKGRRVTSSSTAMTTSMTTTTGTTPMVVPHSVSNSNVSRVGAGGGGGGVPSARPTISRKGLAPPVAVAPPPMLASPSPSSSSSSGGSTTPLVAVTATIPTDLPGKGGQGGKSRTTSGTGASTISAYDAQRLAQYGSNYPALHHQRGMSNNGGTASPVVGIGRVELESSGEEDDDESASDSD